MEECSYLELPSWVLEKRLSRVMDNGKSYAILDDEEVKINLKEGDLFNAILMSPGKKGDHRIFQIENMMGYVRMNDSGKYKVDTFQDLRINFVYRFEVLCISKKRTTNYFVRPIWPVEWEDSLYVDYQPFNEVKLRKR